MHSIGAEGGERDGEKKIGFELNWMTFEVDIKTPMHKSLVFTAQQADLFDEKS